MSKKPLYALALALGFMGCVTEEDELLPADDEQVVDDHVPPIGDPPGENIPGTSDGTCGGAQLKADGACTPK